MKSLSSSSWHRILSLPRKQVQVLFRNGNITIDELSEHKTPLQMNCSNLCITPNILLSNEFMFV